MINRLLVTKLHMPLRRADVVPRPRLSTRLEKAYESRLRLILISAPAGFGKTTLVVNWLTQPDRGQVVWLSLDEGDNDPAQFINLLINALQQINDDIGQAVQQTLSMPQPQPSVHQLITALVNDVAMYSDGFLPSVVTPKGWTPKCLCLF